MRATCSGSGAAPTPSRRSFDLVHLPAIPWASGTSSASCWTCSASQAATPGATPPGRRQHQLGHSRPTRSRGRRASIGAPRLAAPPKRPDSWRSPLRGARAARARRARARHGRDRGPDRAKMRHWPMTRGVHALPCRAAVSLPARPAEWCAAAGRPAPPARSQDAAAQTAAEHETWRRSPSFRQRHANRTVDGQAGMTVMEGGGQEHGARHRCRLRRRLRLCHLPCLCRARMAGEGRIAQPDGRGHAGFCLRCARHSRLSCQIKITDALDGLRVRVPEKQF